MNDERAAEAVSCGRPWGHPSDRAWREDVPPVRQDELTAAGKSVAGDVVRGEAERVIEHHGIGSWPGRVSAAYLALLEEHEGLLRAHTESERARGDAEMRRREIWLDRRGLIESFDALAERCEELDAENAEARWTLIRMLREAHKSADLVGLVTQQRENAKDCVASLELEHEAVKRERDEARKECRQHEVSIVNGMTALAERTSERDAAIADAASLFARLAAWEAAVGDEGGHAGVSGEVDEAEAWIAPGSDSEGEGEDDGESVDG